MKTFQLKSISAEKLKTNKWLAEQLGKMKALLLGGV